ncbi:SH3 domain-containing protein [Roseibium aggregatum]|uniref:SH3 domain-containing protein n=1 Tax=Roseibium aggregatum TaxID=187304 RepID=UPI0025AD83F0|nr:SH3 domain-containing protein [Roseibium aggregatum]WJS05865.1 SH3 domain-containing protein [Roseibium aggregatum]
MVTSCILPRVIWRPLAGLVAGLPLLLALALVPADAAEYFYDHNGSGMRLTVTGSDVRIFYETPRSGLKANGVKRGTLLFNGRVANGYLEGMSRIFHAKCGTVDYFVYGDFKAGTNFNLNGAAPVMSNMSCRVVDNVYEGPNANLTFTTNEGERTALTTNRRGCLKNVSTSLNVRVGPSSSYGRIHEIPAGTCGIRILPQCRDGWCVVEAGPAIGWVSMKFVRQ